MIFCCLGAIIHVVMLLRDVKTQVKKRKREHLTPWMMRTMRIPEPISQLCIHGEEKILMDLEQR